MDKCTNKQSETRQIIYRHRHTDKKDKQINNQPYRQRARLSGITFDQIYSRINSYSYSAYSLNYEKKFFNTKGQAFINIF